MSNDGRAGDDTDLDTIVKDVEALKKDIAALMERVRESAGDTVGSEACRLYDAFAASGEKSIAALARQVEDRPLSTLLIAFGLGFIGAQLLKR